MSIRDEFPCIRYRRKPDYSMESRRFVSAAEFASEGGAAAGWARSPKEVARDPVVTTAAPTAKSAPPEPASPAPTPDPKPRARRKPAS